MKTLCLSNSRINKLQQNRQDSKSSEKNISKGNGVVSYTVSHSQLWDKTHRKKMDHRLFQAWRTHHLFKGFVVLCLLLNQCIHTKIFERAKAVNALHKCAMQCCKRVFLSQRTSSLTISSTGFQKLNPIIMVSINFNSITFSLEIYYLS